MPRYFTHYWANDTAYGEDGSVLNHTCGTGCDAMEKGDIVYAVTVMDGILHPLGRMTVGAVTDQETAQRMLDDDDLWPAEWHIVAEHGSGTLVRTDFPMPMEEAKSIVIRRKTGEANPKLDHRGVLDRQTFRNVCETRPNRPHCSINISPRQ